MFKLVIDGSKDTGQYRVDCECGDNWSGVGQESSGSAFGPALPIAECVVHMKLTHPEHRPDLYFTLRFEAWLQHYWEVLSLREATHYRVGR